MFVSSWLEKPKQTEHQSSEALNCDLFCQSCENKGCIKCPATTVGWSDLVPKKVKDSVFVYMETKRCYFYFLISDAESQCHWNRDVELEEACLPVTWDCGPLTGHVLNYFLCSFLWITVSALLLPSGILSRDIFWTMFLHLPEVSCSSWICFILGVFVEHSSTESALMGTCASETL